MKAKDRRPFTCPVCSGKGQVPPGFYQLMDSCSTVLTIEDCRSCKGTGIVWSEDPPRSPLTAVPKEDQ